MCGTGELITVEKRIIDALYQMNFREMKCIKSVSDGDEDVEMKPGTRNMKGSYTLNTMTEKRFLQEDKYEKRES